MAWLDPFFGVKVQYPLGTVLTQRSQIALAGAGVSAADDPNNARTIVTITAGASTTVASPAGFSGVDTAGTYTSGALAWVTSTKTLWVLDRASTLTTDSVTVVAANGGGNWVSITPSVISKVNTNFTVSGAPYVTYATSGLTAPVTVTVPTGIPVNTPVWIVDQDGSVMATNKITVSMSGGATINGATSYQATTAYSVIRMQQTASNKWNLM